MVVAPRLSSEPAKVFPLLTETDPTNPGCTSRLLGQGVESSFVQVSGDHGRPGRQQDDLNVMAFDIVGDRLQKIERAGVVPTHFGPHVIAKQMGCRHSVPFHVPLGDIAGESIWLCRGDTVHPGRVVDNHDPPRIDPRRGDRAPRFGAQQKSAENRCPQNELPRLSCYHCAFLV